MKENEITYLVSTNLTPQQLVAAGCSEVHVAIIADSHVVFGTRGPKTMQDLANTLKLSEYRRQAMPQWENLEPHQQRDILATATMTGIFSQPQHVIEWLDNQDMWDWLLPSSDWRHEVEDSLTHVKIADRPPNVHVVIDTSCQWTDGALTTCLLNLQRCLTNLSVSQVLLTQIDEHLTVQEDMPTDRIHEVKLLNTARSRPKSYFKHLRGDPPDLVLYLSEHPERTEDVKPPATTIWLTPTNIAAAPAVQPTTGSKDGKLRR